MATRLPFSSEQYWNACKRNAFKGACMFTYEAGTTTVLKETFTTADESVSHPNPIQANTNGIFPEIYGNGAFFIKIQNNAKDELVLEADNIQGSGAVSVTGYANLSDALAASGQVGDFLFTFEHDDGTGVGGAQYEIVAADPGLNKVNPAKTDGSGNFLLLVRDKDIYDAATFGIIYNSLGDSAANGQGIAEAIESGLAIDFTDKADLSGSFTINTGFLSFDTSNGKGEISYTSQLFKLGNVEGISVKNLDINTGAATATQVLIDTVDDATIPYMVIDNNRMTGFIRFNYSDSETVNPATTVFGIRRVEITNNDFTNMEVSIFKFVNMPYLIINVKNNTVFNFNYLFVNDGIINTATFFNQIRVSKRKMNVSGNNVVDSDTHFGDPQGNTTVYHAFILTEGLEVNYYDNHVEGLKTETIDVAAYDIYGSAITFWYTNNTWKNIVNTVSGAVTRTLIKTKDSTRAYIHNNTFTFDETYFATIGKSDAGIAFQIVESTTDEKEALYFSGNTCDVYRLSVVGTIRVSDLKYYKNTINIIKDELSGTPNVFSNNITSLSTSNVRAISITDTIVNAPLTASYSLLEIAGNSTQTDLGDLDVSDSSLTGGNVRVLTESITGDSQLASYKNFAMKGNTINGDISANFALAQGTLTRAKSVNYASNLTSTPQTGVSVGGGVTALLCSALQHKSTYKTNFSQLAFMAAMQSPTTPAIATDEEFNFICDTKMTVDGTITNVRTEFTLRLDSGTNKIFIDFIDSGATPQSFDLTVITDVTTQMQTTLIGDDLNPKTLDYFLTLQASIFYIRLVSGDGLGDKARTFYVNLYSA